MKQFQGRVICPGTCEAEALVSHGGFNTLASYQMALMFHDKQVKCGDQNNPDLYKKPMIGKALCLPETIGSTTGGMVLYTACASGQQPACMLFSKHIDSLAASGAILASVWTDADMPVIDCLGDDFLAAVQTGQTVRVLDGGITLYGKEPGLTGRSAPFLRHASEGISSRRESCIIPRCLSRRGARGGKARFE